MKAFPLLLAVPLLLLALPPTASAAPCAPPTAWDDSVHAVSHSGTIVTVNLVGVGVSCTFLVVKVAESWSEDVASPTCAMTLSDDAVHSVTEYLGTVTVNDVDVFAACAFGGAWHPEVWTLP